MILYSVTVKIEAGSEADWVDWMKQVHIPEVIQTGCFKDCRMWKVREPERDEPSYVMQYRCRSIDDYHRYCEQFAATLQKDHSARFGGRFTASRQILEEVAQFQPR
ncbi:hypothetical protein BH20VER3_BH20VER3_15830 [soil metagenome]